METKIGIFRAHIHKYKYRWKISELLHDGNVIADLDVTTKQEAITTLVHTIRESVGRRAHANGVNCRAGA